MYTVSVVNICTSGGKICQVLSSLEKMNDAPKTAGLIGCSSVRWIESLAFILCQKQQVHSWPLMHAGSQGNPSLSWSHSCNRPNRVLTVKLQTFSVADSRGEKLSWWIWPHRGFNLSCVVNYWSPLSFSHEKPTLF